MIFGTEDNVWFISDCGISFNCKFKKLINVQMWGVARFGTLCSSDESIQIKHFKHHTFIDMCSFLTRLNLQIGTEFQFIKVHRVLNRLSKRASVHYRKNQVLYKTKQIQHTIIEIFTKKNSRRNLTRFNFSLSWRS